MILMRKFILLSVAMAVFFSAEEGAQARRRHRKFKGVIVVNQILKLSGTITNNGKPVPEFSGVREGDVLETGDRSYAVIRIPGLGIFRMGEKTKICLTKFWNRDKAKIELMSGELFSLFHRFGNHEVKLPRSTASLDEEATFYASTVVSDGSDDYCVCDGKVQIKAKEAEPTVAAANTPAPVAAATPASTATATPAPTPTPTPNVSELKISSRWMHKAVHVHGGNAIESAENSLLRKHGEALIQELESLYDLP